MEKRLTKEYLDTLKKIFKLRSELNKESDRGSILMATSFLEYELKRLFEYYLIGNKKDLEEMLTGQGGLATFSSRIKLAYSLGLISKVTMDDLNIIKKIRNDCGHNYETISFEDPSIKQRIYYLKSSVYAGDNKINPKKIFINNVFIILSEIQGHKADLNKAIELTKKYSTNVPFEEIEKLANENLKMAKEYCGENATIEQLVEYIKSVQLETLKGLDRAKNGPNDINKEEE
ncbi:MltR family transcriptional regulator [Flavobacterium sp.]|uniref:MltR family transcriptional regulator n=1 Tax=Flavobacterium sp. TaxID=239 RepID=UPI0031DC679F